MSRFWLVLVALVLVSTMGSSTVSANGASSARIFLSFDAHDVQSVREPIAPLTSFRFYVLAAGTGALGAWEAKVVLPDHVVVTERRLAQPRALDIAAADDEWIVGTGACLPAAGKAPLLLATYDAMLLEPATAGDVVELAAPAHSSVGGSHPAWADCSDASSPRMPVRMFDASDGAILLGSPSDVAPGVERGATSRSSALLANAPNPFNPSTRIRLRLATAGDVRVRIFDLAGRRVRTFDLPSLPVGEHDVTWNGRDDQGETVASGSYVVRLDTPDGSDVRRIALLK